MAGRRCDKTQAYMGVSPYHPIRIDGISTYTSGSRVNEYQGIADIRNAFAEYESRGRAHPPVRAGGGIRRRNLDRSPTGERREQVRGEHLRQYGPRRFRNLLEPDIPRKLGQVGFGRIPAGSLLLRRPRCDEDLCRNEQDTLEAPHPGMGQPISKLDNGP